MTPLSEILKGFNFEEWQAGYAARREKLKIEYCAKYGLKSLTESELSDLDRAHRRLKECENCSKKYCNKATEKFRRPLIRKEKGRLKIETVLCEVWLNEYFEEQCQLSGIPLKYARRTFEDYEITAENEQAIRLARWFLADKRKKGLYFYGGAGTGKTFLASLIAREYVLNAKSIVFVKYRDLQAQGKWFTDTEGEAELKSLGKEMDLADFAYDNARQEHCTAIDKLRVRRDAARYYIEDLEATA